MWGSLPGWLLAALILCVEAVAIVGLTRLDTPTPPTAFVTDARLAALALPIDPAPLRPAPTADGDARAAYRDALAQAADSIEAHEVYAREGGPADAEPPAVAALVRAAALPAPADLFAGQPRLLVGYGGDARPELRVLTAASKALLRAAWARAADGDGDGDAARARHVAAFALGEVLWRERLVAEQMLLGEELLGTGALGLAGLSGAADADRWHAFDAARVAHYRAHIEPVGDVLTTVDPPRVARHVGDYARFALDARERLWRTAATLQLGRARFTVGVRSADQRRCARLLAQLAADPDPVVRAAAARALALTEADLRHAY